jgi:hypothetical protein
MVVGRNELEISEITLYTNRNVKAVLEKILSSPRSLKFIYPCSDVREYLKSKQVKLHNLTFLSEKVQSVGRTEVKLKLQY